MTTLRRRTFIVGGLAGASAGVLVPPLANAIGYPFTLGVASGEPAADGFVIWTRLAPNPLNGDGLGGMPNTNTAVEWQVATDERFTAIVRTGTFTTTQAGAHSVHVTLTGLEPGREYWYRFRTGGHLSPVGRTLTAPARRQLPRAHHALLVLLALRGGLLHRVPADGRGTPPPDPPPRRLHLRGRGHHHEGPQVRARHRDQHARQLPGPPRPVQDGPGPAGRARRGAVARRVGRPRGREQLRQPRPQRQRTRPATSRHAAPPRTRRTTSTCRCAAPRRRARRTCCCTAG